MRKEMINHPMQAPCSCKRKCLAKIDDNRRKGIHSQFWSLSKPLRDEFLFQRVQEKPKARTRIRGNNSKRTRNMSRKYTLKMESGEDQQVCARFFASTLGYKSGNAIGRIFQNQSPSKSKISPTSFSPDMRGRHQPKHKFSKSLIDNVKNRINSYHPSVSHYRRAHAPLSKYLPPHLSVKKMYIDYTEKCNDQLLHYESYRKIVREMNISFTKLGEEECEACETYKHHDCANKKDGEIRDEKAEEQKEDEVHEQPGQECTTCKSQELHLQRASETRMVYRSHTSQDVLS